MKSVILAASLIASLVIVPIQSACAAGDGKFSLETGMDYNTGKYGGTESTDIFYVPFTGKYQGPSWTLKVTVPYLRITGPGNVIDLINGVAPPGSFTTAPVTRSGLGDVVTSATHGVYNGGPAGLVVNLTGKIKFGTASRTKGMGTGADDYALQSDLYQVTGKLTTFGTFGYKVYGSPPGYTLDNIFYGSLGGSYKLGQETSGGVMLSLGQKVISTGSTHVEAIGFINHRFDKDWKSQAYLLKGFTNSVPTFGAGVTVSYLL